MYCEPGYKRIVNDCIPCPSGTFSASFNSTDCKPCPSGTATEDFASTQCHPCGPHAYAHVSHMFCLCDQGYYKPPGATQCTLCPPGNSVMQYGCYPCAPGTFQPAVGKSSCMPCAEGTSSVRGATQCVACGEGRTLIHGVCATCPPGKWLYEPLGRCDLCARNTFKSTDGLFECEPCAHNSYSDMGASRCTPCPEGQAWIDGNCATCPPGYFYNREFNTCSKCARNTFTSAPNVKEQCDACEEHAFAEEGSSSCTFCPNGKALINGVCSTCGAGWRFNRAALSCEACSGGHTSAGGVVTRCERCASGSNSFPGGQCIWCARGHVLLESGAKCGRCPRGHMYNSMERRCEQCPVQTYSSGGDATMCRQCPVGMMAKPGSSTCIWCKLGTALMMNGRCEDCAPGFRYNQYMLMCVPCARGSFRKERTTEAACEACPPGMTSDHSATVCVKSEKRVVGAPTGYLH